MSTLSAGPDCSRRTGLLVGRVHASIGLSVDQTRMASWSAGSDDHHLPDHRSTDGISVPRARQAGRNLRPFVGYRCHFFPADPTGPTGPAGPAGRIFASVQMSFITSRRTPCASATLAQ